MKTIHSIVIAAATVVILVLVIVARMSGKNTPPKEIDMEAARLFVDVRADSLKAALMRCANNDTRRMTIDNGRRSFSFSYKAKESFFFDKVGNYRPMEALNELQTKGGDLFKYESKFLSGDSVRTITLKKNGNGMVTCPTSILVHLLDSKRMRDNATSRNNND